MQECIHNMICEVLNVSVWLHRHVSPQIQLKLHSSDRLTVLKQVRVHDVTKKLVHYAHHLYLHQDFPPGDFHTHKMKCKEQITFPGKNILRAQTRVIKTRTYPISGLLPTSVCLTFRVQVCLNVWVRTSVQKQLLWLLQSRLVST